MHAVLTQLADWLQGRSVKVDVQHNYLLVLPDQKGGTTVSISYIIAKDLFEANTPNRLVVVKGDDPRAFHLLLAVAVEVILTILEIEELLGTGTLADKVRALPDTVILARAEAIVAGDFRKEQLQKRVDQRNEKKKLLQEVKASPNPPNLLDDIE